MLSDEQISLKWHECLHVIQYVSLSKQNQW